MAIIRPSVQLDWRGKKKMVNPLGLVVNQDFGNPEPITVRAEAIISGGMFVWCSGNSATVGSQAASFAGPSDVYGITGASGGNFTGIALQTTASGGDCTIVTRGVYHLLANGTVTAGQMVCCDGNDCVKNVPANGSPTYHGIGRALTTAGSEGYALVKLGGH